MGWGAGRPHTLGRRLGRSSNWRPARPEGSRTASVITNRLTAPSPQAARATGMPAPHHPEATMPARNSKPTTRQLTYLKALAERTGQTFAYPSTMAHASTEINRLKQAQSSSRTERYVERKLIADQIATGPLDAARVREDETSGRGSTATWTHNREQEPPPMPDPGPASPRRRRTPVVGQRTELARYTVTEGERILYGQRIDGTVRFLSEEDVLVERQQGSGEDIGCRSGAQALNVERGDAARPKRPNDAGGGSVTTGDGPRTGAETGRRVELARYRVSTGERVLFGQRVKGVVRVTDVPLARGGRAYLVERGLEEEGRNANAALQALLADYVRQAGILDQVPMATMPV
jgi:hypothetical protein